MTEQSTPSDLAAWVLDHGVGLTPARQKQLAKGYLRLEAQTDIRGRAVVMYRERARKAEARIQAVEALCDAAEDPDQWPPRPVMHGGEPFPASLMVDDIRRALSTP